MGFFKKTKKEEKPQVDEYLPAEEGSVYRDGVFEVFSQNDKYFAKILNYHGFPKVYEIEESEFLLWKDAGESYGKYSISYERDEDFYIEKAHISLAQAEGPDRNILSSDTTKADPQISREDAETFKALVSFYNEAIKEGNGAGTLLKNATLDETFCCAALCERKISELAKKAKSESADGKVTLKIPVAIGKLSENAKRELYAKISGAEKIWVIYSPNTSFQHSAAGFALVCLCEQTRDSVIAGLTSNGQKATSREILSENINNEFRDIMLGGFRGIRFMHKYGGTVTMALDTTELKKQIFCPENIRLRACMIAFFQDIRNGVTGERVSASQLAMYDAIFKGSFLQPCLKMQGADGEERISLSLVKKGDAESGIIELYTSPELVAKSESFRKFKERDSAGAGYRKIDFPKILEELKSESLPVCGFCIDKDNFRFVFEGEPLENLKKAYTAWCENGGSFIKKK